MLYPRKKPFKRTASNPLDVSLSTMDMMGMEMTMFPSGSDGSCKVVMPRTLIDEQTGYMAFFMDTEGNRVGLHASN